MRTRPPVDERKPVIILHRAHATVEAIVRQLTQLGTPAECFWPDLPQELDPLAYGVVFFDADMGHDEQFPWAAGASPIPAIALIGSEAPGRIAWAIHRGADAHLLKPVTGGGIYSAMLIAREAFDRRVRLQQEVATLEARLAKRECVAEATAHLMLAEGLTSVAAYRRLRLIAMEQRRTIEAAAEALLEHNLSRRHDRA